MFVYLFKLNSPIPVHFSSLIPKMSMFTLAISYLRRAMPCSHEPCCVGPPRRVMVESSDKTWFTGEGSGKPLQHSSLENPMTGRKGKKIGHRKRNSPGREVPNMLLESSGEITPEIIKRQSQSKNNSQFWMWLVMEVKSNAVKNNIAKKKRTILHRNLEC